MDNQIIHVELIPFRDQFLTKNGMYTIRSKKYCLLVFLKGNERSVSVFRSCLIFRVEFFTNFLERYSGARPFSNLYIVVAVLLLIILLIVGHLRLCINGLADESNYILTRLLLLRTFSPGIILGSL